MRIFFLALMVCCLPSTAEVVDYVHHVWFPKLDTVHCTLAPRDFEPFDVGERVVEPPCDQDCTPYNRITVYGTASYDVDNPRDFVYWEFQVAGFGTPIHDSGMEPIGVTNEGWAVLYRRGCFGDEDESEGKVK